MFQNLDLADLAMVVLLGGFGLGIASIPAGAIYCGSPARKTDIASFCYDQSFAIRDKCLRDSSDPACDLIQSQNLNVKVKN